VFVSIFIFGLIHAMEPLSVFIVSPLFSLHCTTGIGSPIILYSMRFLL
jgi:hypothetical protein